MYYTHWTRFTSALLFSVAVGAGCGLGAVGTSAQNNSGSATVTTTQGVLTTTGTQIPATSQSAPSQADSSPPTTAPTPAGTAPSVGMGQTTPVATATPTPTTPPGATQPVAVLGPPLSAPSDNTFYTAQPLTTAIFSWDPRSGVFTAILSTDKTVCLLRSERSVKTRSRELQIKANVKQTGQTLTLSDISATMVLYNDSCRAGEQAMMGTGASNLDLFNLSTTSVSGSYSFTLSLPNDGPHVVSGSFEATACEGLKNGVPEVKACIN